MRRFFFGLALAVTASCQSPTPTTNVGADTLDLGLTPAGAVSGELDGARFTLREAWFRVDRREPRARVDLILSEGRATRLCATSDPPHARHILVRVPRAQSLAVGTLRGAPGAETPVSANFETHASDHWVGRPGSVAIAIDTSTPTLVTGRIRACFGPGAEGCVAGAFQARQCVTELDLDGPLTGNVRPSTDDAGAPAAAPAAGHAVPPTEHGGASP
ncbi:MAG: hypothetical protein U0326_01560 [Polyangiales bacterium]